MSEEASAEQMPRLFTVAMLAARWSCSANSITRLLDSGKLPGFRIGRMWRIPAAAVEAHEACPVVEATMPPPVAECLPAASPEDARDIRDVRREEHARIRWALRGISRGR